MLKRFVPRSTLEDDAVAMQSATSSVELRVWHGRAALVSNVLFFVSRELALLSKIAVRYHINVIVEERLCPPQFRHYATFERSP